MDFGTQMYVLTPSREVLQVISPIDAVMMIGIAICAVFAIWLFYMTGTRAPKVVVPVALIFALVAVDAASNGSVTLDAAQGKAVVDTVTFGYPKTYRYPLSSVMDAYSGSSEQSSAPRVVFRGR